MWKNSSYFLHQASNQTSNQASTPKSSSSSPSPLYDPKTLISPRLKFPHLYRVTRLDPTLMSPNMPMSPRYGYYSPVYAYPYPAAANSLWPTNNNTNFSSPKALPSPRLYNIGRGFGLVPATPRQRVEEGVRMWSPSTELIGSCGDNGAHNTRGIVGVGPADEEGPMRMDRFKVKTVDIDEMVVQDDANKG